MASNTRKIPADSTLYGTDNGRILCGAHLGASAAYTGRDISGQPIEILNVAIEIASFKEFGLDFPGCEHCHCGAVTA